MALLAAQPAEKSAQQQFSVEAISLRAAVLARHRDARGMDDESLNTAPPEAIASGFISGDDALDLAPSLAGFVAPTMQELQQRLLVGSELLERLAFDAGNNRRNEPLRLAHLDHGDDRTILLEGGEGLARVKRLRHGALRRLRLNSAEGAIPSPLAPCICTTADSCTAASGFLTRSDVEAGRSDLIC
jgi:hypothetical protein